MIRRYIGIAALAATVALPVLAHAQGVPGGIERGSVLARCRGNGADISFDLYSEDRSWKITVLTMGAIGGRL